MKLKLDSFLLSTLRLGNGGQLGGTLAIARGNQLHGKPPKSITATLRVAAAAAAARSISTHQFRSLIFILFIYLFLFISCWFVSPCKIRHYRSDKMSILLFSAAQLGIACGLEDNWRRTKK